MPNLHDSTVVSDAEKIKKLKEALTILQNKLRQKNKALDAMHWVWCDGGCEGGTHRYTPYDLTEEIVGLAERNTRRLRSWFGNNAFKKEWREMTTEQKNQWMKENINNND